MDYRYDPARDIKISLIDFNQCASRQKGKRTLLDGTKIIWFKSTTEYGCNIDGVITPIWYGCRDRGNDLIAVDIEHRFIVGFARDTKKDLFKFLKSLDISWKKEERPRRSYESSYIDSPTGIKLDRNLRWQLRMLGVVFKNKDTDTEWKFSGVMGDLKKVVGAQHSTIEKLLFENKIINGWYIARIEETKGSYLLKNNVKVPTALPNRIIARITLLPRSCVQKLVTGLIKEKDGWILV